MGGFGHKWVEWFECGWFGILEKIGESQDIENGYLGFLVPGTVYWYRLLYHIRDFLILPYPYKYPYIAILFKVTCKIQLF